MLLLSSVFRHDTQAQKKVMLSIFIIIWRGYNMSRGKPGNGLSDFTTPIVKDFSGASSSFSKFKTPPKAIWQAAPSLSRPEPLYRVITP